MEPVRKQFTFYYSFYDAIQSVGSRKAKLELYETICAYALLGQEPDEAAMHPLGAVAMKLIRPTLDSAKKKADAGRQGGSKPKACLEKKISKKELEIEKEVEVKKEIEKEKNIEIEIESQSKKEIEATACGAVSPGAGEGFETFWKLYPKKIGREAARKAFAGVDVPVEVLVEALQKQKKWKQWTRDDGRYIPKAVTWLEERRWEDQPPAEQSLHPGAVGDLGDAEMEDLQRSLNS